MHAPCKFLFEQDWGSHLQKSIRHSKLTKSHRLIIHISSGFGVVRFPRISFTKVTYNTTPTKTPNTHHAPPWCNADSTHSTSQNRNRELLVRWWNCWVVEILHCLGWRMKPHDLRRGLFKNPTGGPVPDFWTINSRSWMIESQMSSDQNLWHSIILVGQQGSL